MILSAHILVQSKSFTFQPGPHYTFQSNNPASRLWANHWNTGTSLVVHHKIHISDSQDQAQLYSFSTAYRLLNELISSVRSASKSKCSRSSHSRPTRINLFFNVKQRWWSSNPREGTRLHRWLGAISLVWGKRGGKGYFQTRRWGKGLCLPYWGTRLEKSATSHYRQIRI